MSRRSNDKNQQILKALLKEQGNGTCADCKTATHPRWASWNLGIFICIRCSGIHRSMGTHISRVKSVDLDTWTDEQVASMVKWGNNKANVFWEAKLPGGSHTPDGSKIENFIRTKYDMKKWAASTTVPDPSSIQVNGTSSQTSTTGSTGFPAPATKSTPQQDNRRSLNANLLDLEFGSPIAAPNHSNSTQSLPQSRNLSPQLTSGSTSTSNYPSNSNITATATTHTHNNNTGNSTQSLPQQPQRDGLKKSILSLYSTPMASSSTPNFPMRSNNTTPASTQSFNTSNNSTLAGLNFGSSNNTYANSTSSTPSANQWADLSSNNTAFNSSNVWASSSTPQQQKSNGLDDDLFKNVWN